jgi:hypothetical protein
MAIMLKGTSMKSMSKEGHSYITGDDGRNFIVVEREVLMNCEHLSRGERVEYEAKYDHTRNTFVCSSCRSIGVHPDLLLRMDEMRSFPPCEHSHTAWLHRIECRRQAARSNLVRQSRNEEPEAEPDP